MSAQVLLLKRGANKSFKRTTDEQFVTEEL